MFTTKRVKTRIPDLDVHVCMFAIDLLMLSKRRNKR